MQFKQVKKEILNCKKRDFVQNCRFYAKKGDFLQIKRNVVHKSTRMHNFLIKFEIFSHVMSCFKKKFSKTVLKLSLNLRFSADLHHLQDRFSTFLLNFISLAKNAKREIWRQKGDLRCKICNCIKCLAQHNR